MFAMRGGYIRISIDLKNAGGTLADVDEDQRRIGQIVEQNRMKVRKVLADSFGKDVGYELVLTLEESFIVVETWPEVKMVKAIVDICHMTRDNTAGAHAIADGIIEMFHSPDLIAEKRLEERPGV